MLSRSLPNVLAGLHVKQIVLHVQSELGGAQKD